MSKKDPTQIDQVDLFSQALCMLDEANKDVEVSFKHLFMSLDAEYGISTNTTTFKVPTHCDDIVADLAIGRK